MARIGLRQLGTASGHRSTIRSPHAIFGHLSIEYRNKVEGEKQVISFILRLDKDRALGANH